MYFLAILLTPIFYLYILVFKLREKLFGYDIKYRYLPEQFDSHFLPVHMDFFWLSRGFFGRNKCLVPVGHPYSERFDDQSPWFQSWVGTYSLFSFSKFKFRSELDKVSKLGEAAIADQDYWLASYGVPVGNSRLIQSSIRKTDDRVINGFKQEIYYGEIDSAVDDSKANRYDLPLIHLASARIAELYNKSPIDLKLLIKDKKPSIKKRVKLYGYFSSIEVSPNKYLLTYVCAAIENKAKTEDELLRIISNFDIIKNN